MFMIVTVTAVMSRTTAGTVVTTRGTTAEMTGTGVIITSTAGITEEHGKCLHDHRHALIRPNRRIWMPFVTLSSDAHVS